MKRTDDLGRAPALLAGADEAEHERAQGRGEMTKPGPVRAAGTALYRLGHLGPGQSDGTETDREVDEEDPPPGQAGGERAAEQRADGDGEAGDRPPDAEGDAALTAGEGAGEQRQRHREHDRAADALDPRARISISGEVDSPQINEARVKTARPRM